MTGRALCLGLLGLSLLTGCALPSKGTPVFVDLRAGDFWSGRGKLIEVSQEQSRCRVAVRDRSLRVVKLWVDCAWVHPRHNTN